MTTIDNQDLYGKKKGRFLRVMAFLFLIFALIGASFFGGMKFEIWGGINRFAPIAINYLRENFFGDEFVLSMEQKVFALRDDMKQEYYKNAHLDMTVDVVDLTIHEKTSDLINYYLLNADDFSYKDTDRLKILIDNYDENLKPIFDPPIVGEGLWKKYGMSSETFRPLYAKTFLRTDEERDFVKVHIYKFDLDRLKLDHVPGRDDTSYEFCDGRMTKEQREKVMWIFSGGFQYRHGHYGIKYNNKIVLPPKKGAATLLFYNDGSIKITEWDEKYRHDENIYAFRQNELMLVIDGKLTQHINKMWGLTPHYVDPIYTVRSGIGLTENNELIFAYGEHLSAKTLAIGMIQAGVVNGMHLDMNYYNVHLVNVKKLEGGKIMTYNEDESLSYFRGIYSRYHPRDYFILTDKTSNSVEKKNIHETKPLLDDGIKKDIAYKLDESH